MKFIVFFILLSISTLEAVRPPYQPLEPYVPPGCRLTACYPRIAKSVCLQGEKVYSTHPCPNRFKKQQVCCDLVGISNPAYDG